MQQLAQGSGPVVAAVNRCHAGPLYRLQFRLVALDNLPNVLKGKHEVFSALLDQQAVDDNHRFADWDFHLEGGPLADSRVQVNVATQIAKRCADDVQSDAPA